MALLIGTGFESRGGETWSMLNAVLSATGARTGTMCIYNNSNSCKSMIKMPSALSEWYLSVASQVDDFAAGDDLVWVGADGTTVLGKIRFNTTSRKFEAYVGASLVATGSFVLGDESYHQKELHVLMSNDAGTGKIQFKIDGVLDIDYTGDTIPAAEGTATYICFGFASSLKGRYDDFTLCDTTGGSFDTWIGDLRYVPIHPTGNGATSGLTNQAGNSTNNYQAVDDLATGNPDSDTTYVKATADGQKDTYAATNPTLPGGTIRFLQMKAWARKTNASVGTTFRFVLRSGGTDYPGADLGLTAAYVLYTETWFTDPNGTVAWEPSAVDALEIGVEGRGVYA